MKLHLIRYQFSPHSFIGKLDIDGVYECKTLENAALAIPDGSYDLVKRWSHRHGSDVIGICDVPGRTDIEIHIANWPQELLGCVAVGQTSGVDQILGSASAFNALMAKFEEPATIQIESIHLDSEKPEVEPAEFA